MRKKPQISSKGNMYISHLKCPECGLDFPIPRYRGRKREEGHIKDLYCPRCKAVRKMIEEEEL